MESIIIDCTAIDSPQAFHRVLKEALHFPAWYGSNLDALFDCLTDICQPVRLEFSGWREMGDFSRKFLQVFSDAAEENPALNIVIS